MAKLQLYIAKSKQGYKSLVNFNPTEEVRRHITDWREALKIPQYDASHINIFFLVRYIEQGTLLAILRTIPDGRLDHLAATVFIPDGLEIEPDVFEQIIENTKAKMGQSALTSSDISDLRAIYSADYPQIQSPAFRIPSEGRDYAYVRIGGHDQPSFSDLAQCEFYQPAYTPYSAVLLVEDNEACHGTDLTTPVLQRSVPLDPPQKQPQGFVPHLYHRIFDKPYLVPLDEPVDIQWKKPGFEPVVQSIVVPGPDYELTPPDLSTAVKTITPATFYITAQRSGEVIKNVEITVNDTPIHEAVTFTCNELTNARVEVSADGFFSYVCKIDLASTTQALIQLKEKRKIYRFELAVDTPELHDPVHFNIQTKQDLAECPVEGYEVSGDGLVEGLDKMNRLIYSGGSVSRSMWANALLMGAGLVIGLVLGWLFFHSNSAPEAAPESVPAPAVEEPVATVNHFVTRDNTSPVVNTNVHRDNTESESEAAQQPLTDTENADTPEVPASGTQSPGASDAANQTASAGHVANPSAEQVRQAVTYIQSHGTWKRSEMEAIPALRGLFDDMNNYNFDRIINYWGPRFSSSERFRTLVNAAKGSATKRNPRTGAHAPTYNRPDDDAIGWRGYTYHIDP